MVLLFNANLTSVSLPKLTSGNIMVARNGKACISLQSQWRAA